MNTCYHCFTEYPEEYDVCPRCGTIRIKAPKKGNQLYPGATLKNGRFIIGLSIGAGGFGIVYRAWDRQLQTLVAIKEFFAAKWMVRLPGECGVVFQSGHEEEFHYRKERFLKEAQYMAKFQGNRNVAYVYDYFAENNTAYIVMELLEGETLKEFLKKEQVSPDRAVEVIRSVGEALEALHGEGIIHRDVAPDNIFLCDGSEGRIVLMDFGAARLEGDDRTSRDIVLKHGYSPVEQYAGVAAMDERSDLYSLGATMYQMLTGERPPKSTDRCGPKGDPVRPLAERNPWVGKGLSDAVAGAMAIEQEDRPKSVEEFLKELHSPGKDHSWKKVKRKLRHLWRRSWPALAGILALAVLAAAGRLVWRKLSPNMVRRAAIEVWYSAEEGSREPAAMEAVAESFRESFPQVEISLKGYPSGEYGRAIQKAAADGKLPALFESTCLPDEILAEAADAGRLLTDRLVSECLYLDQLRQEGGVRKQIPLGFEVPAACVITAGAEAVDYLPDRFSGVDDFGEGVAIAADAQSREIVETNFGDLSQYAGRETFLDPEANTSPVLLTSSMAIGSVLAQTSRYQVKAVFYDGAPAIGRFTYEWSLGNGTEAERAAAEKLLGWMLESRYQDILMVGVCSEGQLPLNKECLAQKISRQQYLHGLQGLEEKFVMAGE